VSAYALLSVAVASGFALVRSPMAPDMAESAAADSGTAQGELTPVGLKEGDVVAYSKFAGTEVEIGEVDHVLLKEEDCIGVMPGDITTLAPLSDRVVIKVRPVPTASPPLSPHTRQMQLV
jgi:co-chaperonin GroES (HSP10)